MMYDREYKELEDKYSALLNKYSTLEKDFEQYKKESVKWSVEDFMAHEETTGYSITEEKAQEALEHMIYQHDALYGITWENVIYYLELYGTKIVEDEIYIK